MQPQMGTNVRLSASPLRSCPALPLTAREGVPVGCFQDCKCCLLLPAFPDLLLGPWPLLQAATVNGWASGRRLLTSIGQGQSSGQERALGTGSSALCSRSWAAAASPKVWDVTQTSNANRPSQREPVEGWGRLRAAPPPFLPQAGCWLEGLSQVQGP